jgi:hypothetical protein
VDEAVHVGDEFPFAAQYVRVSVSTEAQIRHREVPTTPANSKNDQGRPEWSTRRDHPEATRSCDRRAASLLGIEALSPLTSIHHLDQLGVSFLLRRCSS